MEEKRARATLVVPRELVKPFKNALQTHEMFDRAIKIKSASACSRLFSQESNKSDENQGEMLLIPTTVIVKRADAETIEASDMTLKDSILNLIGLSEHITRIGLLLLPTDFASPSSYVKSSRHPSLLAQTISKWLVSLPPSQFPFSVESILSQSPWTYTIYPPLLLLPANTFSSPPWPPLFDKTLCPHLPALYSLLCTTMKVTHIALNGYIPSLTEHQNPNILRNPNITPLQGDFSPPNPPSQPPTPSDLVSAFWCTARQNGIHQTWAPLHTMFSRGNISEKTRLLSLPSLTASGLGLDPAHTSAVDLYAGIGYFAFSYAKAGVSKILCWELSGWSIEGLRRGAAANGWHAQILSDPPETPPGDTTPTIAPHPHPHPHFLLFPESNTHAPLRIAPLRSHLPPIRHVNCGLLPSSRGSWETAVRALDPGLGGWVHAHENVPRADIARRRREVVAEFCALVGMVRGEVGVGVGVGMGVGEGEGVGDKWEVRCGDVVRVKGYGPGVEHCVFDVEVLPVLLGASS